MDQNASKRVIATKRSLFLQIDICIEKTFEENCSWLDSNSNNDNEINSVLQKNDIFFWYH
jgi:hypothetical protein